MTIDLFRCCMTPAAGKAVADLYTPDENGRIYCGQGRYTDLFENQFAEATGLRRAPLGVNSCSAAIDLALHLIGVEPGDEVISTPLTCTATNGPIVTRGATIVWADINPITGLIDPYSVANRISEKTKAVIAVDWAGRSCDYQGLRAATRNSIPIVEDAAHRLSTPTIHGDYVCYSFGPIKHLTTGGYGGALLVPAEEHERAELLRWHGLSRRGPNDSFRCEQDIPEIGYRYHMTDDQAVVGLANLSLAIENVKMARSHAKWYSDTLRHIPAVTVPDFSLTCDYWLFGMIVHDDRDGFMRDMQERGIPTGRVHARNDKHTAFQAATIFRGSLPGVDYFDSHQVNLPVGGWLEDSECELVLGAAIDALKSSSKVVI